MNFTQTCLYVPCLCFQQIAQHQFDGEPLDSSVITTLTGVEEDAPLETTDTVNPELVASAEVDNINSAESIDSVEVLQTTDINVLQPSV